MQQLSNSSQLRGSNFLSERSYSLKCLSSICSSTPGFPAQAGCRCWHAGQHRPGGSLLKAVGHRIQDKHWTVGRDGNETGPWWTLLQGSLEGRGRMGVTGVLCDLFKTLGIWCGGLLRDSGCLTLGDLQGSLQSKDSAWFETKVALQVPGTENVQVHQCSQIQDSHDRALTLGTHHPALAKERPAFMQNTWTARGCLVKGSQ